MPLLWVSLSFLAGILIGTWTGLSWINSGLLLIPAAAALFLEQRLLNGNQKWRRYVPLSPLLLVIFILMGMLRFGITELPWKPDDLAFYNDSGAYTFTAWVSAPPDVREDTVYLQVSATELEDPYATDPAEVIKVVRGKARIRLPEGADFQYGDLLRFKASPLTPADDSDFSYKKYLSRLGIHTIMYYPKSLEKIGAGQGSKLISLLDSVRQSARRVIFRQFPQPESGLLAGVLLGLDEDLPQSLERAYQATGTAHIIAISGSNMALLAGVLVVFLSRVIHKKWAFLIAAPVLVLYTLFVGGSPSVIRAAVMSILAFGGYLIGRRHAGMTALFFTAAMYCLFNPQIIADAGFQLSFAATFGLLLFAGPLQNLAEASMVRILPAETATKVANPLSKYLLFTLAAQVTTLPVIALHFGRISISALLANPLILPAQPFLLGFGALSTIAGLLHPLLGKVTALIAWPLLAYTNRLVELLARIKGGSFVIHPQFAVWVLVILVVFILLFVFRNFFKKLFKGGFTWIVFALLLVSVSTWSIALHQPDGRLHIQLLRAGDESAVFIRAPGGETLLLDPGEEINELSAAVSRNLSPWDYRVDDVWLTGADAAGNLTSLNERIPISRAVLSLSIYEPQADQPAVILPEDMLKVSAGESVEYEDGFVIRALDENAEPSALYMTYGQIAILVPNGMDYARIREAAPQIMSNLSVLILGEDDVSYIPPRVWNQLDVPLILWNSPALAPDANWIGTNTHDRIEFISDGTVLTVEPVR